MNESRLPERIKKNIEIYQLNENGSELVNRRFEEISKLDNLRELSVEFYPSEKKPICYILTWETNVR